MDGYNYFIIIVILIFTLDINLTHFFYYYNIQDEELNKTMHLYLTIQWTFLNIGFRTFIICHLR